MKNPISSYWQNLSLKQAWILTVAGILLEVPVRWILRPDIPFLRPGNPWFNLPLRIGIEAGMVFVLFATAFAIRAPLTAVGIPRRRWTLWEWSALAIVGAIELLVVIILVGDRWPRIWSAGLMGQGLLWVFSEFLFGVNQETGSRGLIMSGLLRITGWKLAYVLNTLVFLAGPLHGPGLVRMLDKNPGGVFGLLAGVVVSGLFFSWLRHRTDNVVLCGILHGIVNGFMNGAAFTLRANQ